MNITIQHSILAASRGLLILAVTFTFLNETAVPTFSQQATAKTTTSRGDNGCSIVEINVNPGAALVKDVHLCVAKTDTPAEDEKVLEGDPINDHYKDKTGAGLPTGFDYKRVIKRQNPDGTSVWCAAWTNKNAALGGPATFKLEYCGGRGDVKKFADRLFLTKGGTDTFGPADVIKKFPGHIPTFSVSMPRPSDKQKQDQKKQVTKPGLLPKSD